MRRLHRDLVADAVAGIQPEIGRGCETPAERNQHALRNIARIHAHLRDAGALDVQMQRRQVEQLLHVHVSGAGNAPQPVGNLLRDLVVGRHVGADELNVDGRRQAEVQDLGDDVGRLEEELHARELPRQLLAQLADVVRRRMMVLLIQAHQNFCVAGADHAGVAVGKIDAGVGQPDVVEDGDQLVFGDLLPQILLDFIA